MDQMYLRHFWMGVLTFLESGCHYWIQLPHQRNHQQSQLLFAFPTNDYNWARSSEWKLQEWRNIQKRICDGVIAISGLRFHEKQNTRSS